MFSPTRPPFELMTLKFVNAAPPSLAKEIGRHRHRALGEKTRRIVSRADARNCLADGQNRSGFFHEQAAGSKSKPRACHHLMTSPETHVAATYIVPQIELQGKRSIRPSLRASAGCARRRRNAHFNLSFTARQTYAEKPKVRRARNSSQHVAAADATNGNQENFWNGLPRRPRANPPPTVAHRPCAFRFPPKQKEMGPKMISTQIPKRHSSLE